MLATFVFLFPSDFLTLLAKLAKNDASNRSFYSLHTKYFLVISANCTSELCHNGATCIPAQNGTEEICQCSLGFQGSRCQYGILFY